MVKASSAVLLASSSQRVHVGVRYVLKAQTGSHVTTSGPKYVLTVQSHGNCGLVGGSKIGSRGKDSCSSLILGLIGFGAQSSSQYAAP